MIAAAWLKRGEGWLFLGGLLTMLAVSLVLNHSLRENPAPDWSVLMWQSNLATAGVVGLLWLCYLDRVSTPGRGSPWLPLQQVFAFGGNATLIGLGVLAVVNGVTPANQRLVLAIGRPSGWLALLPAVVSAIWFLRRLVPKLAIHGLACAALMVGGFVACSATQVDLGEDWLGYHVLTLSGVLVAGALLAAGWWNHAPWRLRSGAIAWSWGIPMPKGAVIGWVCGINAVVVLLALGGGWTDPGRPAWPMGLVVAVSAELAVMALWTRRPEFSFASGLLFNVVGYLFWISADGQLGHNYRGIQIQIVCLGMASLVWSWIDLVSRRVAPWAENPTPALPVNGEGANSPLVSTGSTPNSPPISGGLGGVEAIPAFRHLSLWTALLALTLTIIFGLATDALATGVLPRDPVVWIALVVLSAATLATIWDPPYEQWSCPLPQLYLLGLLGIGNGLHNAQLVPDQLLWLGTIALGLYVLATTLVCVLGLRNPFLGDGLTIPKRRNGWPLEWFALSQAILSAVVVILSAWSCLRLDDMIPRLSSCLAVVCLPMASLALTPHWRRLLGSDQTPQPDEKIPRIATLVLGVIACVWLHCAIVAPTDPAPWLHRNVLAMAAVTWMSVGYGLLLPRLLAPPSAWTTLARRLAARLGVLACSLLLVILVQEFFLYNPDQAVRRTPMHPVGVIVVSISLGVLIAAALTMALAPTRDYLKLSERGRTLYVYAAEVLVALLLFHLRLNVPDFFPRIIGTYWVFAIMAIAFLGVGLSELCQRAGIRVLANPLQRTAMFLPVLPLAAFLIRPLDSFREAADATFAGLQPWTRYLTLLPNNYHWHAAVWMLMGVLYLLVALTRRSTNLALIAAALANAGLWVLWGNNSQLTFLLHPQIWLIPIGAIVLAAESMNRDRLQPSQTLALRYAGMLLIYLSSTADMFISGLGNDVLLPIALAILSVSGVFAGILLRVRAFLFLGVTFLFLVIFSQIWHAAVDQAQTWVWWASGIVLGVAILTLFALFEKRRNDVVKMLEDLKRWR